MSFESLRKLLSQKVKPGSGQGDIQIAQVFETFRAVLEAEWGAEKAGLIQPVSFQSGKLRVTTASSAAKQELRIQSGKIRNAMNRQIGTLLVREIVLS